MVSDEIWVWLLVKRNLPSAHRCMDMQSNQGQYRVRGEGVMKHVCATPAILELLHGALRSALHVTRKLMQPSSSNVGRTHKQSVSSMDNML